MCASLAAVALLVAASFTLPRAPATGVNPDRHRALPSDILMGRWHTYARKTRLPGDQVIFSIEQAVELMQEHASTAFFFPDQPPREFRIWKPGQPPPFGFRPTGRTYDWEEYDRQLDAVRRTADWRRIEYHGPLSRLTRPYAFKTLSFRADLVRTRQVEQVNLLSDQTEFYVEAYQWSSVIVDGTFWFFRADSLEPLFYEKTFYLESARRAPFEALLASGRDEDALPTLLDYLVGMARGSSAIFSPRSATLKVHLTLCDIGILIEHFDLRAFPSSRVRWQDRIKRPLAQSYEKAREKFGWPSWWPEWNYFPPYVR